MTAAPAILAHAGGLGWDELLCTLPVAIVFFVFLILGARSPRPPPDEETPPGSDEGPSAAE
jgi:hypothetical protein